MLAIQFPLNLIVFLFCALLIVLLFLERAYNISQMFRKGGYSIFV